jgi:hypothetical protein
VSIVFVLGVASADCAGCHPREADAHAASRHARAAELAIFTVAASKAGTSWCKDCHQPAGPRTAGLECLSCHGVPEQPDAIRSTRRLASAEPRGHATVVDPAFAVTSCARCHEFTTPVPDSLHRGPVVYSRQPLQSTVSELRLHAPRARCSDCHDVHRASGAHDPAMVQKAVTVSARAISDGVELTVRVLGTGHRFPTGDPFRRLVLTVCDDRPCDRPIARKTIGRGFALVDGVWAPVRDHTLRDGESRVLRFPRARFWRAQLFYGDPALEAKLPASEVSLELAAGHVP